MAVFFSTLNQIAVLFGFIFIGFLLAKIKFLPDGAAAVLSKLENAVFIPALVLGTFIENFTLEKLSSAGSIFLISFLIFAIVMPLVLLVVKVITRDSYLRNIYTYGLCFSNSGFMGNAVVKVLFPEIFFEYIIFTLPLWIMIYLWGVPALLISDACEKQNLSKRLRSFVNPMFSGMVIGMIIGFFKVPLPMWIKNIIAVSVDCMSPVAMLLTGITVSSISLRKTFLNGQIYLVSFIRLIIFPVIFMAIASFISVDKTLYFCALCALSMPLGLNTIVIPAAYGKDTLLLRVWRLSLICYRRLRYRLYLCLVYKISGKFHKNKKNFTCMK